jgi:hypothetical protein
MSEIATNGLHAFCAAVDDAVANLQLHGHLVGLHSVEHPRSNEATIRCLACKQALHIAITPESLGQPGSLHITGPAYDNDCPAGMAATRRGSK